MKLPRAIEYSLGCWAALVRYLDDVQTHDDSGALTSTQGAGEEPVLERLPTPSASRPDELLPHRRRPIR